MYADSTIVFTSSLTTDYIEDVHAQFWIWKHNMPASAQLADNSSQ